MPTNQRHAILLLPEQHPSFECAYVAAAVAAATAASKRRGGCWSSYFAAGGDGAPPKASACAIRVRRCRALAAGAACLLVQRPREATSTEEEIAASLWEGSRHGDLPDLLAVADELLGEGGWRSTIGGDGDFAAMELSTRIRASRDNPALLGPCVRALSQQLRASAQELGLCFFGGSSPSLLSDVPVAGALLTSRWWCQRVVRGDLDSLKASEQPLKGRDLVVYWLLSLLATDPARTALATFRGERPLTELLEDQELAEPRADVLDFCAALQPPSEQVLLPELLTAKQQDNLDRRQEETERVSAPLGDSVRRKDVSAVKSLLEANADIETCLKSKHHEFGLVHLAASLCISCPSEAQRTKGHPAHLIAADLGIDILPRCSAAPHSVDMVRTLLEARASLSSCDSDGCTPVFYAAVAGDVSCLDYMIETGGAGLLSHRDRLQRTALYWAASNDQANSVRWLLDQPGRAIGTLPVDAQSNKGRTALAKAAWADLPEIAALLLSRRADPRVVDDHGRTVLHMAAWGRWGGRRGGKFVNGRPAEASVRCVELLLETPEGQECLSTCDSDGATPLTIACSTGALDALKVMLDSKAGQRQVREGPSQVTDFLPLTACAFRGHAECMSSLLACRADVWRRSASGNSALDVAVMGKHLDPLKLLAKHLVDDANDPGARNDLRAELPKKKETLLELMARAVDWACRIGNVEALRALLEACPDVARAQDFVHLCLADIPEGDVSASPPTWPPFPPVAPSRPGAWEAQHVALASRAGFLSTPISALGLPGAQACCAALLGARACVVEGTLCGAVRQGLLSNALGQPLLHALVDAFLAEVAPSAVAAKLSWPLVAAANAGDTQAAVYLLHRSADPEALEGLALGLAASSGSTTCAAALVAASRPGARCKSVEALLPEAGGEVAALASRMAPAAIAAAHGHASVVLCLLELEERRMPADGASVNLRGEVAEVAAAFGQHDIARWLVVRDPEGVALSSTASARGPYRSSAEVLHFRANDVGAIRPPTRSSQGTPSVSQTMAAAATAWEALASAVTETASSPPAAVRKILWVETCSDAAAAVASLRSDLEGTMSKGLAPLLGVDVECYGDVVCTVQLSTSARDVVVDALRLHGSLEGLLRDVLADPGVLKLFHAPKGDLRWLRSNFGLEVNNVFDTATAAAELRRASAAPFDVAGGQVSLKNLCSALLGVELDKTHQRSDWRLRPLPPDMLNYAATDARVLLALALELTRRLEAVGGLFTCRKACGRLCEAARPSGREDRRIGLELL